MSDAPRFSIARGGPVYRVLYANGFISPTGPRFVRLSLAFAAVTWLPFVLLGFGEWVVSRRVPSALLELSVHMRLLAGLPFLLFAEAVLEERCGAVLARLDEQILDESGRARLAPIVREAERRLDSWIPEAVILVLAEVLGQVARHGAITPGMPFNSIATNASNARSPAFSFYVIVGLPLFALFTYRWLFRWLVWSLVLFRLARMDLQPIATHPDHAGGLDCLSEPVEAFAVFALGFGSVAAASWWDKIRATGASLTSFAPILASLLFAVLVLSCGPLLAFVLPMHRARRRAIREYGDVIRDFVRRLEADWVDGMPGKTSPVGSTDSSHLTDADSAYQSMAAMRVVPLRLIFLAHVALAVLIPILPLVATQIPIAELLRKVAEAALGAKPF